MFNYYVDVPVKGLYINGATTPAKDFTPDMHPWTFPCDDMEIRYKNIIIYRALIKILIGDKI